MLDPRKLRLLRELHVRGTVAAVAEALSFTPSAVSQQLAQLQREAGVPLTEKAGRRLRLTDAGLRLAERAGPLLAELEAAEADLQAAAGVVRGRLRVASLQTPLISLVPDAYELLAVRHPELRLELQEVEPEDALPALALGELDAAVAEEYDFAPRRRQAELVRDELGSDTIHVVLPAAHPAAAGGGPVALADLAGEVWVGSYAETHFQQMSVSACRAAGFEPDVRHRCNDALIMLALVAAGAGVALVPRLARPERHPGVAVRALDGLTLERTIFCFTRRSSRGRPAIEALVDALAEGARDHLETPDQTTRSASSALSSRTGPGA